MFITRKFAIMFLLLLSVGSVVWSQVLPTTPPVYVSGGPTIYQVANGTVTAIFTSAGANFESLAIGPDNATDAADLDAGRNAKYAYFLYACDPAGRIIRIAFRAGVAPAFAGSETVYDATVPSPVAGFAPECGRSSSAGDFYVTNKSGSGVFVFSGIANVGFGLIKPQTPTALNFKFPKNMTGRGITQKYVGDLLFVDNFDNQVLRSPYAVPFANQSTFINTSLNGPVGLAAAVTTTLNAASGVYAPNSMFFVANSNTSKILATQPPVSVFTFDDATQTGLPAASCPGLNLPQGGGPPQVADYLASAPTANADNSAINNTIYLVTNSNNSGSLWTWNTALAQANPPNCVLTQMASIGTALSGVAVAPAPVTLNLSVSATPANPTPTTFNFNSSIFQLTASGANNAPCAASVTAYPLSLATVNSMINLAQLPGNDSNYSGNNSALFPLAPIVPPLPNPATPLANLGDGGFETAYVAHWPSCMSVFGDGGFVTGIFNFVDSSQYTNPRAVQCDNSGSSGEPQLFPPNVSTTCGSPQPVGVYPLGGPIAGDIGTKSNSVFAMVNENLGTAEPGFFCGFQNPLTGNGQPPLPNPPPSFTAGTTNTVNVKFKLSMQADCKKNFITDAVALISVARIFDANGAPAFSAINVQATASSLDLPPLFNSGNQQYSFTLNLPSVFAQGGAGTYSLTVTFITSNTTNQTTLFNLTQ